MAAALPKRPAFSLATVEWKGFQLAEIVFCLALASTCLPIKIYPAAFLLSSAISYLSAERKFFPQWAMALSVFSIYALLSFLSVYEGQFGMLSSILKLLINFSFLYFSALWLAQRDNSKLLLLLDFTLHLLFLLTLAQLLVYHQALDFKLITGSSSSGQASMLYNTKLFFWGLDDKNMFGARIALLGFIYILLPVVRHHRIAVWRMVFIFILAYLSLSRTPIVALLIGCGYLLWTASTKKYRILMFVLLLVLIPFVLEKIIRVNQLTASNDGMGVRLVYWTAFFQHFTEISPWGNGFMSAPAFLSEHARFYHGEPHIHNTFMTAYLEMGIIGFLSYTLFLGCFIRDCLRRNRQVLFWIACFLPLLAIMCILYSGYDNDIVMYLSILSLFGTMDLTDLRSTKIGI
ncbi:hypothetical protein GCM10028791_34000 [Echinicola sediminis]